MRVALLFLIFFQTAFSYERLIVEPNAKQTPIIQAINNAHSTIDLVMYEFNDWKIYSALVNAKKRGVKIRIILQTKPYGNSNANNKMSAALKKKLITVKAPNPAFLLTHEKAMIIDNKQAFIMTFNFTWRTFHTARNFGVITNDSQTIHSLQNTFNTDWTHTKAPITKDPLVWCPNNCRQKINNFISKSTKQLNIYQQLLSDYQLINEIAKQAKKGITVNILIPQEQVPRYCKQIKFLNKNGVHVYASQNYYIHAKVFIDDSTHPKALIGSMNLSASSLNKNRELGIITDNKNLLNQINDTFMQDWQNAKAITRC